MADRIIGFKEADYQRNLNFEITAKESLNGLMAIAKEALAVEEIDDYIELVKDPHEYIVNKFWELYAKDEPPHMDKSLFLSSKVPLNVIELGQLRNTFHVAVKNLKYYAPTLTKTGLKSNLKKTDFNIYLNPKKKDEYEAVENFLNAANVLREKYNASGGHHLIRYASGKLRISGIEAYINPYDYAK